MTYSVQNIIVDVPITIKLENHFKKNKINPETENFEILYHGSYNGYVGFCGVKIGEFDECGEWMKLIDNNKKLIYKDSEGKKTVNLTPTEKQTNIAREKVDKLPQEIRELCPEFGVYIICGTS